MKTCNNCKEEKELSEFQKRARNKDGHTDLCKVCKRAYDNAHYKANPHRKEYIRKNRHEASRRNAKYRYDYLSQNPCVDCGENDPIVLQFDHDNPAEKDINISNMRFHTIKRIQEEINKCTIRCANCHARRTAKQFGWYKDFI
jgi:hypothetical protein